MTMGIKAVLKNIKNVPLKKCPFTSTFFSWNARLWEGNEGILEMLV